MTKYLLDTNIISELVKPAPAPRVLLWLEQCPDADLYLSTLTVGEIRQGILRLSDGARRRRLEAWFTGPTGPAQLFAERILPFGIAEALCWAELRAIGYRDGRPRDALDTIIAATAKVHGCVVVTLNGRDFPDVEVLDPNAA